MGETATTWRCSPTRFMFSTTTTLLSQRAEPSQLSFGTLPKRRMGRGITRISRIRCGKKKRGCASRVPPSPGAAARRTREVLVEGATPPFLTLVRHRRVLTGARSGARLTPASGGRSLHSDPCGIYL